MRNGRKLVVVGAEPGSEYGMDFLETVEGKEGMGIWLAKRGITFIALTRAEELYPKVDFSKVLL